MHNVKIRHFLSLDIARNHCLSIGIEWIGLGSDERYYGTCVYVNIVIVPNLAMNEQNI